jgi:hypothetical protein
MGRHERRSLESEALAAPGPWLPCKRTFQSVISMMGAQGVEWKRHGRSVVIGSRETVSELRSPCLYQPEPEQLSGPRVRIR